MENKKQVYLLTLLMVISVIFLIMLTQLSKIALSSFFMKEKIYSSGTYLASVDISYLTKEQALEKVRDRVAIWKRQQHMSLSWQTNSITIPSTAYHIDTSLSLDSVVSGQHNPLAVDVSDKSLKELLKTLNFAYSNDLDPNTFKQTLINNIKELSTENKNITVNTLFKNAGRETSQTLHEVAVEQEDWMNALDNTNTTIAIQPDQVFSFRNTFQQLHNQGITWNQLNTLSSAFYQDALYSNLEIIERHISNIKPNNIASGLEAKVSDNGKDLKIHNPNSYSVMFSISETSGQLRVMLTGETDPLTYVIKTEVNQQVKPRQIIELKDMSEDTIHAQTPIDAMDISVQKNSYYHNELISAENVSRDTYIPLHDNWEVSTLSQGSLSN